jgi:hypothetical protein
MKEFGVGGLPRLVLLSLAVTLLAQTPEKRAPIFSLAIEEEQLSAQAGYRPTDHELIVKYTNISQTVQRDGCMVTPVAYHVAVLRDGIAVDKKKSRSESEGNNEENSARKRIKVTLTEADSCHGVDKGLSPGESVRFPLWVSSEYDMSVPGTYEITVKRNGEVQHPHHRCAGALGRRAAISRRTSKNPAPEARGAKGRGLRRIEMRREMQDGGLQTLSIRAVPTRWLGISLKQLAI